MKQKGTKNITWTQRLQLEALLKAGLTKKEIANLMGVCLATVYNEIKRGAYEHLDGKTWKTKTAYSPNLAEDRYRINMTAKGAPLKIGNDFDFVRYVEQRVINDKLSPCAVLGEINRKCMFKTRISKTTIYRYIKIGIFMNIKLLIYLLACEKNVIKRLLQKNFLRERVLRNVQTK